MVFLYAYGPRQPGQMSVCRSGESKKNRQRACGSETGPRALPVRRIRKVGLLLFMERMQMLRRLYVVRVLQTKKNAQGPLWEARKVYIY